MNLILKYKECENFRNRAKRRYPNEHFEVLFGTIEGDTICVTKFIQVPYTSDEFGCNVKLEDIKKSKTQAKRRKLKWIGTIHTHCGVDTCEHLSSADHKSAVEWNEKICGVLLLWPSPSGEMIKSRFSWNLPASIKIEYGR